MLELRPVQLRKGAKCRHPAPGMPGAERGQLSRLEHCCDQHCFIGLASRVRKLPL